MELRGELPLTTSKTSIQCNSQFFLDVFLIEYTQSTLWEQVKEKRKEKQKIETMLLLYTTIISMPCFRTIPTFPTCLSYPARELPCSFSFLFCFVFPSFLQHFSRTKNILQRPTRSTGDHLSPDFLRDAGTRIENAPVGAGLGFDPFEIFDLVPVVGGIGLVLLEGLADTTISISLFQGAC
jgi:hypothetical protein